MCQVHNFLFLQRSGITNSYEIIQSIPLDTSNLKVHCQAISSGDDGYEHDADFEEPFIQPANKEEELIFQLTTKLAVPEIPQDNLK